MKTWAVDRVTNSRAQYLQLWLRISGEVKPINWQEWLSFDALASRQLIYSINAKFIERAACHNDPLGEFKWDW